MLRIVGVPRELRKFFGRVCSSMSVSLQIMFELYVIGLLIAPRRERNVADLVALLVHGPSRSNFARLFTEYWWDHEQVIREAVQTVIELIDLPRRQKVYLVVDDTPNGKTGRHMDALCKMRNHSQPHYFLGHNVVALVLVVGDLQIPVDFRLYLPKDTCTKYRLPFQTKNELAAEMIRAFTAPRHVRVVVLFDCWYLNPTVVKATRERRFPFVSYLRSNRNLILPSGRKVKVREYAHQVSYQKLRFQPRGRVSEAVGHQTTMTLPSLGKVKLVLTRSELRNGTSVEKYIVTDQLTMPMVTVVQAYDVRWEIEVLFRTVKQAAGWADYQMRDLVAIVRHLYASTVAALLLVYVKLKYAKRNLASLADARRWVQHLSIRDTAKEISRAAKRGLKMETITERYATSW